MFTFVSVKAYLWLVTYLRPNRCLRICWPHLQNKNKKTGNKTTSRTIEGELMEGEMQKNAETRKLISIAGGRKEQLDGNARRDQS